MTELEAMIDMLEDDLDWLRKRNNPNDASDRKRTRIFLTLAQEIQTIKSAPNKVKKSKEETK